MIIISSSSLQCMFFPNFLAAVLAAVGCDKKLAMFMVFCNIGGLGSELNMSRASVIPFKVFPL